MANEIIARNTTAKTVYAQVMNRNGQIWNANSVAFENPTSANWTSTKYCIALSESGSTGIYRGNFPALSAGVYSVTAIEQASGSPAVSDVVLGSSVIQWSGTEEIPLSYITPSVTAIKEKTDQLTYSNASMVDAAWTQNGSDPTGVPSPTATKSSKVDFIFAYLRNKRTQDSTSEKLYANNETTVIATKTKLDNGTTLTVGEAS